MQKDINYTFKMLYVIAIFMIVDGHVGTFDYLNLNDLIRYQNFHIGLFIFTSGYFLSLSRSLKEFFLKKLTTLIVPLYLWNLFYGILCWYLNHYQNFHIGSQLNLYNLLIAPITDGHQYIYNMASWFLVPLFGVQIIGFSILKPFKKENKEIKPTFIFAFFILAFIGGLLALHLGPLNKGASNFQLAFIRILYFLPIYAFGILYKHTLQKYDTLNTPTYLFILLAVISVICTIFPKFDHIPSWLDWIGVPSVVIYLISFASILFWLRIAKILSPIIKESRSLLYISNHTFDIMMHHFVGFMLIKAALQSCEGFNRLSYKTNIWYYYYPGNEHLTAWLYISITIVIALLTGFTSRKIYDSIKQLVCHKKQLL